MEDIDKYAKVVRKIKARYTEFGLRVKHELAKRRLSQAWLAEQLHVSNAYITNIILGYSCPEYRIKQIQEVLFDDERDGD